MGENTAIEWATHTFNPWLGCTKVSPACKHCYAERDMDHRYGKVKWGPNGTRTKTARANWRKPLKWNCEAAQSGVRARVFCASLADVFEDWQGEIHSGGRDGGVMAIDDKRSRLLTMNDLRAELFALIDETPWLDWLLLTKRPENIRRMWPMKSGIAPIFPGAPGNLGKAIPCLVAGALRQNVWLGTSVENDEYADKRIPELRPIRDLSPVLFLSCEPLLGPLDLRHTLEGIDWVIAGGESGPHARPSHPGWFRGLRDQCQAAGVPYLFKQWGEWCPLDHLRNEEPQDVRYGEFHDRHAHSWVESCLCAEGTESLYRVGKAAAGRQLDGREWNEFPATEAARA